MLVSTGSTTSGKILKVISCLGILEELGGTRGTFGIQRANMVHYFALVRVRLSAFWAFGMQLIAWIRTRADLREGGRAREPSQTRAMLLKPQRRRPP